MKKDIHPKYYPDAKVVCACGNTWTTGSSKPELRTEICSNCHPFFTGQQQRLVDTEGRVEAFSRRIKRSEELKIEAGERSVARAERERDRQLVELVDEEETVEPIEQILKGEDGDAAEPIDQVLEGGGKEE